MQERALLINASLEIGETPSGGLSVSVRVPASTGSEAADADPVHARIGA
jgi:hypothetical protein